MVKSSVIRTAVLFAIGALPFATAVVLTCGAASVQVLLPAVVWAFADGAAARRGTGAATVLIAPVVAPESGPLERPTAGAVPPRSRAS